MKYECVIVKYIEVDLAMRVFPRPCTVGEVESIGSIALVPESIERRIFLARGEKVMETRISRLCMELRPVI
jgi:hypothetical protein